MALTKWGFIYTLGADGDPDEHTDVLGSEACRLVTVGVERVEQAPEAAKKLLERGVELIELCGAFGPVWTGRVIEAIGRAIWWEGCSTGRRPPTGCTPSSARNGSPSSNDDLMPPRPRGRRSDAPTCLSLLRSWAVCSR